MKDFVQVKGSYRKNPMGPARSVSLRGIQSDSRI